MFHRGGFSRAALAVEEHIVRTPARHQQAGVAEDLLTLPLVPQQLIGGGAVRVGYGDEFAILLHFTGLEGLKAILPWQAGVILVAISALLTIIAGLIPSRVAAKKDPVEALRSE